MNVKPLLDFIGAHESDYAARRLKISPYNVVWGGIEAKHRPKRPLVDMTVGEVLAWQDSIDPLYRSEAAGRYQIMEDTLRGLYAEAGMATASRFDAAGQDHLATALLRRRGLDRYLGGTMSAEAFCNNLAREWASLPQVSGPNKGKGVYDGDGLNRASGDVDAFLAAVEAIKGQTAPIAPVPQHDPGLVARIIAAILRLFPKGA